MLAIDEIKEILRDQMDHLKEEYKVREIGIFGSRVRDEARDDSDLDVLVTVDLSIDLLKFIELENYLSEVLGIKVDLVMKDSLKKYIGRNILQDVVYV